tara:strand:- start:2744 stop:2959 length:216 start_codon:yes stop_codon:yes gene_type:complete
MELLMPRTTSKTKPISLRLSNEVRERVKKLSDDTGLIQAQLYDLILRAGCKAIAEEDDQISIPLHFRVVKK